MHVKLWKRSKEQVNFLRYLDRTAISPQMDLLAAQHSQTIVNPLQRLEYLETISKNLPLARLKGKAQVHLRHLTSKVPIFSTPNNNRPTSLTNNLKTINIILSLTIQPIFQKFNIILRLLIPWRDQSYIKWARLWCRGKCILFWVNFWKVMEWMKMSLRPCSRWILRSKKYSNFWPGDTFSIEFVKNRAARWTSWVTTIKNYLEILANRDLTSNLLSSLIFQDILTNRINFLSTLTIFWSIRNIPGKNGCFTKLGNNTSRTASAWIHTSNKQSSSIWMNSN